ncbi:SdpI family protein [uncultured Corynebacterium sp.]|uniref:SdpI family protein n=1 Tax=uncultured Corynebacterium sp. TaxID=159447 RepID=UPI00288A4ADB|nr:SdpI family protein [uncultured Corynebacterium sp.]
MLAIAIIFFTLAAIFLIVGGLATARKLPGNSVVGLRLVEIRKTKEAWDNAHAIAGPFWMLSGVSLLFGGVVAISAHGWMWTIPALTFVISILALSIGSNMGSRAAFLWDEAHKAEEGCGDSCNCSDDGCGSSEPEVDLGALRKAAEQADHA